MNPGFQGTIVQQDKTPTLISKAKSVGISAEKSFCSWSPMKLKKKEEEEDDEPKYTIVGKTKLRKGCW